MALSKIGTRVPIAATPSEYMRMVLRRQSLWERLVQWADERLVGDVEDRNTQERAVTFVGTVILLGMILGTVERVFTVTKEPSAMLNNVVMAAIGSLTTLIATSLGKNASRSSNTAQLKNQPTLERNKE